MAGKKARLASWISGSFIERALLHRSRGRLVIFGYHRVRPNDPHFKPEFAEDVYGPTEAEFEAHLRWLKAHTDVLSEAALLERLQDPDPHPGRLATMISFDDGYRDNYERVYPLLQRYELPAVFFVPTEAIEARKLGWWDEIAYLLKRAEGPALSFDGVRYPLDAASRAHSELLLYRRMQREPAAQTHDLVARLAEAVGQPRPDREACDGELMTWEQLREVSSDWVTVGAHTHRHRVLATLPEAEQREEITRSKALLEEKLGRPVRSMAYPVGRYLHFTPTTQRLCKEAGYQLGYSYCTGLNRLDRVARYDVKRLSCPEDPALFGATAAWPELFDWD